MSDLITNIQARIAQLRRLANVLENALGHGEIRPAQTGEDYVDGHGYLRTWNERFPSETEFLVIVEKKSEAGLP